MSDESYETRRAQMLSMTDDELLAAVEDGAGQVSMAGACCTTVIRDEKAFVKRLPLTDIESAHPYSTFNHFNLPAFYSYGVGSAGFGPWRELAALEELTGVDGFPVLLTHRVMPRSSPPPTIPWTEEEYVHYWRDSESIGRYLRAKNVATQELWIVLADAGAPAYLWMANNPERIDEVLSQVFDAIGELRARHFVHFDAHLGNIVTDGSSSTLVDFGLAMSDSFDLNSEERSFLDAHRHYDYGCVLVHLGAVLAIALGEESTLETLRTYVDDLRALEGRCPSGLLGAIDRYRKPILYMSHFFEGIRQPHKTSIYEDKVFADLLRTCGVVAA